MARRTLSGIQFGGEADWSRAPYLSIDIGRVHDDVLADTIDLVEECRLPVTWLVTHDTTLLAGLRGNPYFELGIDSVFSILPSCDDCAGRDAEEVNGRFQVRPEWTRSIRKRLP